MAEQTRDRAASSTLDDGFVEELQATAEVLSALDTTEDAALELHASPFNPSARSRMLRWLKSEEYRTAAARAKEMKAQTA